MSDQKTCSLMLITQNNCEVCEGLKNELPEEDIGIEVINLSEDERAHDLAMKHSIRKVPILILDCGEDNTHTLRGEDNIKSFIQEIS